MTAPHSCQHERVKSRGWYSLLELLLPQVCLERLHGELLAILVRHQAVLAEHIVIGGQGCAPRTVEACKGVDMLAA